MCQFLIIAYLLLLALTLSVVKISDHESFDRHFNELLLNILRTRGGCSDVVSVSCFGVRFSVMFHFMFVHYTFSSVWVAEWSPFGK